MIFHIFIYILQLLRVYYELTMWPAPRWLDSSVGRALHRYRRGHGFESCSGLNFTRPEFLFSGFNFTTAWVVCVTVMIKHKWYLSPQFKYMIFHLFIYIIHILRVDYELTKWPAPRWLDSSVGRALHRYRRGHGFESRSVLNFFFQVLISQLLKLCVQLWWSIINEVKCNARSAPTAAVP